MVRELVSGDPIVDVDVVGCDAQWRTDADGRFGGPVVGAPCVVRLASADWQAGEVALDLVAGARVELALWAVPAESVVAVYGDTPARLDADEVAAVPGALGDPIRALSVAPGLTRTPLELGWLLVRGGAYDHVSTFVDGVRVPTIRHLGGYASVLHPSLVGDVRLDLAPADARYGEALAGMAEVTLAEPPDDASAAIGANVVFAGAAVAVPFSGGALRVAGRRSYFDVVLDAVGQDGAAAPRFWDGALRLDVGDSSLTALAVHDALETPTADGDDVTVTLDSFTSWGAGEVGPLRVVPSYALRAHSVDSSTDHEVLLEHTVGLRTELSWERLTTGVDAWAATTQLETIDFETEAWRGSAAPYVQAGFGQRVGFDLGLRMDNLFLDGQDARFGLSPQAASRVPLSRVLTWRSELGRSRRGPRTTVVLLPENATQPLEVSDAASTGLLWQVSRVAWSVDGVVRRWDHVAGIELDGSAGTSVGAAAAVETAVDVDLGAVDVGVVGSYTTTLVTEDPDEAPDEPLFDQPLRLDALVVWAAPWRLIGSGRFRYSTGTPYPYDIPGEEQVFSDVFAGTTEPLPTGTRLPDWYALDLQVRRAFPFRHGTFELWISVQNVTNRRVPEPGITGFGEAAPSYALSLPLLPLFGFDITAVP